MQDRKEFLSALKVCRFCLTQNEPLIWMYEKSKRPNNLMTLPMKILTFIGIEIFPSDKMPQHICSKCKFFMDVCHGYKQMCRKSEQKILHYIQQGVDFEPISWTAFLSKVYKVHMKNEFNAVKSVTQDGSTVKVTAEEVSDSADEGDNDNVYNVKFEDGSEVTKNIKVITSVGDNTDPKEKKKGYSNISRLSRHLRTHVGERAYPCKHCDKTFLKSHHYTRHLRLKHGKPGTMRARSSSESEFRCGECDEIFTTQDELIFHSALHATESLTCPLCQEKFEDVDTVTLHIKSHVNDEEFMCEFCELIFTSQEKLDCHIATHESELNEKELTEEEDDYALDTEGYDDDSINVKEEDGHMIVEIKKAGEYMLADPEAMEEVIQVEKKNTKQSEVSAMHITLDASGPLLTLKTSKADLQEPAKLKPKSELTVLSAIKKNAALSKKTEVVNITPEKSVKQAEPKTNESQSNKKTEEVKLKAVQNYAIPSNSLDRKDKMISKVESTKVENSTTVGGNDLSLRLLEKELQDLKRTNSRNDVSKTPAKPNESLRIKRSQMHTSTPKPRAVEKKEATVKPMPEKPVQEKRPPGRPPKENREVKNANIKEEKELKEIEEKKSNISTKEEKETKDVKENSQVMKNGASDRTSTDDAVRRSARPSKVKDYAKMIKDSANDDDETSDEDIEEMQGEEPKPADKSVETPRRGRKPKQAAKSPAAAASPASSSAPRKRGRPRRKDPVPPKVAKKCDTDDEDQENSNASTPKLDISKNINPPEENKPEIKSPPPAAAADASSNVIVSPSGHTLKKVPIKALPPGVKPLPLPRKITGELCEMQIGKKVVKVQKIVMTKAEVEAMTKKGLVEMKDGTIVLKQGIKLPGSAPLKSAVASDEQKETTISTPAKPTRCDLGED